MAVSNIGTEDKSTGSSWVYDPKVRGILFQILVFGGLIAWFVWISGNTLDNLAAQGKSLGFDFLVNTSGFSILPTMGTWLLDYQVGVSTYWDVYLIGIVNTFVVAILGVIAATLLGFVLGIFRLSNNFVLKVFSGVYIEMFRNIPLLLWLFIFYFGVLRSLPDKRSVTELFGKSVGINITGLYLPAPIVHPGFWMTGVAVLIGLIFWIFVHKWAKQRQQATGEQFPTVWAGLGAVVVLGLGTFLLTGSPLEWEIPVFKTDGPMLRRGYEQGIGMVVVPELIAVWAALTFYTASFIAEIVRAGILAVSHGQTEAAHALGLRNSTTLNLVIIPQAMRVIIPPLTSQFLNLIKNSSLAVAIAYPELVSIFAGTALNQVGKEVEMIFMMMLVYLTFSILTAAFMNWFNSKMKLVER